MTIGGRYLAREPTYWGQRIKGVLVVVRLEWPTGVVFRWLGQTQEFELDQKALERLDLVPAR